MELQQSLLEKAVGCRNQFHDESTSSNSSSGDDSRQILVAMWMTMEQRNSSKIKNFDAGSTKYLSTSYAPTPYARVPIAEVSSSGPSILSPVVVAMVVVLVGAFLIVSYYRVFDKYCNRNLFCFWSAWHTGRDGSPSTIVLVEEHGAGSASTVGLDDALISRIPTRKYDLHEGVLDKTECSVCLGEFEVGEVLRILPKCNHPFHIPCIDTWLAKSSTCPLCRINIAMDAALPLTLMPAERESPAHVHGPLVSLTSSSNINPQQALINLENEVLHENVLELLECGQFSGPSRSMSPSSNHSLIMSASSVGTQETEQVEMEPNLQQHSRHLSPEAVATSMRETQLIHAQHFTSKRDIHFSRQLSVSAKPRLLCNAREEVYRPQSEGGLPQSQADQDLKGKHPHIPFSSPQLNRSAPLFGSSSDQSTSLSSDQKVAERLPQDIFYHTNHFKIDLESTLRTSAKKQSCLMENYQDMSTSTYSSHKSQQILQDASSETMRSIYKKGNPLLEFSRLGTCHNNAPDDSTSEGVNLQFFLAESSDDEDKDLQQNGQLRSQKSCEDQCQIRPIETRPFKTSMSLFNSYESLKKAHTSEPVFEVFNF